MSPITEGLLCAGLIVLAYTLRDIDSQARDQTVALQQIAAQGKEQNESLEATRETL